MKIYISSPGQFYSGFDSKLRGEGRWLVHLAALFRDLGHSVTIFSNDPVEEYVDQGVRFTSIYNNLKDPTCDLLISMDAFPDLPESFHKTNISPLLTRFCPSKRAWAGYFPLGDWNSPIYDMMPVIHPWNYRQCREGRAIFLPIVTHRTLSPVGFYKTCFHWYSKNAHEEPQYILGVMRALHRLVFNYGAQGSFVDGIQIERQTYRKDYPKDKELETKRLFSEIVAHGSESFSTWAPYSYVRNLIANSKLLVGVHHPVAAPSMAEIAVFWGAPILWKNQKDCPPYDQTDIPFLPDNASDEEVEQFILDIWVDEAKFTSTVKKCQAALHPHSYDEALQRAGQFLAQL